MYNITFRERDRQYLAELVKGMDEYLSERMDIEIPQEELGKALSHAFIRLWRKKKIERTVTVHRNKNSYVVPKWQIIYIERDKRDTYIYFGGAVEPLRVSDKLDEMDSLICDDTFVRCHNSFIVNLDYVAQYKKVGFQMKDGAEIPISRSHQKEVKQLFSNWEKESCFQKEIKEEIKED